MSRLIEINEEKLTKLFRQEVHENNQKKIQQMLNTNLNLYLTCENVGLLL